jgi:phosphohistidine phosphatase
MLTLALLRHAKSSWATLGIDDFDRPLAERGMLAAPLMGAYIAHTICHPDLILCSSANRTRATLDLVLPTLSGPPPAVIYEEQLYLAAASQLLARLRRVSASQSCVLMIGHNPGLHDLALLLAPARIDAKSAALALKFPTAAVAVLTFAGPFWSDVAPGGGTLAHFMTPALLQQRLASLTARK